MSVYGGLDKFIENWEGISQKESSTEILHTSNLLPASYDSMSTIERSEWVITALSALGKKPSNRKARRSKSTAPAIESDEQLNIFHSETSILNTVRPKASAALKKIGAKTVGNLIYLFPRRHNNVVKISGLSPGEDQTIVVSLWEARPTQLGRSVKGTETVFGDETGNIRIVWFNQPYLVRHFKPGKRYVLSGRVSIFRGHRTMDSPSYEELKEGSALEKLVERGRLFPIYPLTEGITQQTMRKIVREALSRAASHVKDIMPSEILQRNGLIPLNRALWQAHYPDNTEAYEKSRLRLAFEELFVLLLRVLYFRPKSDLDEISIKLSPPKGVLETFISSLPFELTKAQKRVLEEVTQDIASSKRPMSRLIQGDVGSGKTVIALAALVTAATSGFQSAIMAPTEILAEQHFLTVGNLLQTLAEPSMKQHLISVRIDPHPKPILIGLLLGNTPTRAKRELQEMLSQGTLDIVIGTHAVIQENVSIPNLSLAIVDEQHRFGVKQRAALRDHGEQPHMLVMSATPIPRTLTLTLYGDLDLSTLDELPPGRQAIRTKSVGPERRSAVYDFVRREIASGKQAFFIYPLIDESDSINARATIKEHSRLSTDIFPDLEIGLLHGRMPTSEKKIVMDRFRSGDLNILVSTAVVEVGIDVPNATVMLIESADRFGLAQLHQFRGRVGRGSETSYCILIAESPSEDAKERLLAMEKITDGFELAEVDLQLRGPGDYFGTRQSGLPNLRMARLTDADLLTLAREEASALLESDPELSGHPLILNDISELRNTIVGEAG